MAAENGHGLLFDEEFLRKLEKLQVLAHRAVRGRIRGEHKAWRAGRSLEFLDYRKYQPGDDFRYIDWNVLGRLDKLFIKLFRAEEDLTIHFLIDVSRSMALGRPSKDLYAKKTAAALGYIGLANQDRIGVTSFAENLGDSMAPRKGRKNYWLLLRYLESLDTEGRTDFNASLAQFSARCKRPGLAVIISDLLDPKGFRAGMDALKYRKFDLALIHVLDPAWFHPPATGRLELRDVETGETKRVTLDENLFTRYRARVNRFLVEVESYCHKNGIDYCQCRTDVPFEDFLLEYLLSGALFQRSRAG